VSSAERAQAAGASRVTVRRTIHLAGVVGREAAMTGPPQANERRRYGTNLRQANQPREPRGRDLEPRARIGIVLFALALLVACCAIIVFAWYDDMRGEIERERTQRRDGE